MIVRYIDSPLDPTGGGVANVGKAVDSVFADGP
jgi:hypothetical protein